MNGYFSRCAQELMRIHTPHEMVESEYDPLEIPGLSDRIVMTRSQLLNFHKRPGGWKLPGRMWSSEDRNLGVVVNSFLDLESANMEYFKEETAKKAWGVGPVSLCNRNVEDMGERGQQAAIDEQSCLSWLNAREPNSVLYVRLGSLAKLTPEQLLEIAYGLEASSYSFIWAVGKIFESSENGEGGGEGWLPSAFEETEGVPERLILEHPPVGGYMTHCGWNSTLESVSAGVPMVTFPRSAEQFFNEKLVTDELRIGVQVGSMECTSWNTKPGPPVGREKVEAAVRKVMDGVEQAAEMRRRAKDLGEKVERAVEQGGSSYEDAEASIQELKSRKKV
ncbi:hypothetical protein ACJRO7_034681 [Eucalyptus globulus]|uniref:Uncharacterized protein n=1 Tax=Eucalyptus globulus TaxID=34317 RepID=A0ABD3J754_EUCGL